MLGEERKESGGTFGYACPGESAHTDRPGWEQGGLEERRQGFGVSPSAQRRRPVGLPRELRTGREPGQPTSCSEKAVLWPIPRSSSSNHPGPGHCHFPSTHLPEYVALGASGDGPRKFTKDPASVLGPSS